MSGTGFMLRGSPLGELVNVINNGGALRMAVRKYTKDQVAEALREGNGILSVAAQILGCHRNTIYNYLEDDPELKDIVEERRETLVDEAEQVLLKKVKEEDIRCVMFVLRTLGRHRGYSSRPHYAAEEPSKFLPPAPTFWDEISPFEQKSEPERRRLAEFEPTPKKGVKKSNKRQNGDETKGRLLQSVS